MCRYSTILTEMCKHPKPYFAFLSKKEPRASAGAKTKMLLVPRCGARATEN
jgi:hypothetical protein